MREDTVRFWRSAFITGGIEALKKSVAPGPAPVKAECALAVAAEVLTGPVADRPELDAAASGGRDRKALRRAHLLDRPSRAAPKGTFRWRRPCQHAERPPGRGRGGPCGPAPKAAQSPGGGASKASRAALAERAHWLTVEWLPKYAPELNDIEGVWRDLKRHHLAHQTFTGPDDLNRAIHQAVITLNTERNRHLWGNQQMAALVAPRARS